MCNRRRGFTISLVLVASLLLSAVTVVAQGTKTTGPTGDWSRLNTVASGSKLIVKLKNGKTVEGKLNSVSDTALSVTASGKPVDLSRDDVSSVYQVTGKSATKATLIGLGVGAGAGAVIGLAAGGNDNGFKKIDHAVTAGLTVLGAGAGALTGFVIGKRVHRRVLIYQTK